MYTRYLLFDHFQFALIQGPNIPGSYTILLLTALDFTSITSHIHNWHCFHCGFHSSFLLELFFHSSPVAYGAPIDWRVHLSVSFFFFFFTFSYCSLGFKARILKWFAIPFSSGPHFVKSLHHDLSELVTLYGMVHSFIELDKAVVHVISLASFLWLWFSFCLPSGE